MYAGEIYVAVIRITGSVDWGQGGHVGCYEWAWLRKKEPLTAKLAKASRSTQRNRKTESDVRDWICSILDSPPSLKTNHEGH